MYVSKSMKETMSECLTFLFVYTSHVQIFGFVMVFIGASKMKVDP